MIAQMKIAIIPLQICQNITQSKTITYKIRVQSVKIRGFIIHKNNIIGAKY
jgi:hypothetical protein